MSHEPADAVFDAVVIGGGPAGAVVARLLASWGHTVALIARGARPDRTLAESVPPSTRRLFSALGLLKEIDEAGYYRSTGNTAWWGGRETHTRFDLDPSVGGYQVLRAAFDAQLLQLSRDAGVTVLDDATVEDVSLAGDLAIVGSRTSSGQLTAMRSRYVLDCSGRTGVIGREFRVLETRFRTLAIAALWHNESGWAIEAPADTLVESYDEGWAWSVPLSRAKRYFAVMIDPRHTSVPGQALARLYRAELAKTRRFRAVLEGATRVSDPHACDASLYTARRFAEAPFLLVGDAGSFIDPLSSFGVKKALASAWRAGVVINTCLCGCEAAAVAFEFHSDSERHLYDAYFRQAGRFFREAFAAHRHPFWADRVAAAAQADVDGHEDREEVDSRDGPRAAAALDRLKASRGIALVRGASVRLERRPEIVGREVVLSDFIVCDAFRSGLRFQRGVNLPALLDMAGAYRQVPDLFEAYNRRYQPVALPDFLTALSNMLAKGILASA